MALPPGGGPPGGGPPPPPPSTGALFFEEINDLTGAQVSSTAAPFDTAPVDIGYTSPVGGGLPSYGDPPSTNWGTVTVNTSGPALSFSGLMIALLRTLTDMLIPAIALFNQVLCWNPATKSALWKVQGWADLAKRRMYRCLSASGGMLLSWIVEFVYFFFSGVKFNLAGLSTAVNSWLSGLPSPLSLANVGVYDGQVDAIFSTGYATSASGYYLTETRQGYIQSNINDGSEAAAWLWTNNSGDGANQETTLYDTALYLKKSVIINKNAFYPGSTWMQIFGVGPHQKLSTTGVLRVLHRNSDASLGASDSLTYARVDFNTYPGLSAGSTNLFDQEFVAWAYVLTSHPYVYVGSATELPWDNFDHITDGHTIVFLPGRSAAHFPKKVAAGFDASTLNLLWQREFTDLANMTVTRSNGCMQSGLVYFLLQGFWYILRAADGALLKKAPATGVTVRSNATIDDLMMVGDSLIWTDDSGSPTMKIMRQG